MVLRERPGLVELGSTLGTAGLDDVRRVTATAPSVW
jgi:hypothetical protein